MSDYRRLVSYIYSYPGGVREKNVGFAKAEVRGGQFKLYISLKGVYTDAPESFGVYLMFDRDTQIEGRYTLFPIGSFTINNGMGQYNDLLNPENINSSGYTFADINGIAIARKDNRYYMMFSLWEDGTVAPDSVNFVERDYKKVGVLPMSMHKIIKSPDEQEPVVDDNMQNADDNIESIMSEGKMEQADENLETQASQVKEPEEQVLQSEELSVRMSKVGNVHMVKAASAEQSQYSMVQEENTAEPDIFVTNHNHRLKLPQEVEAQMINNKQQQGVKEPIQKLNSYEKIFQNAKFIDAFDDDYYYDCIEVAPEQLRELLAQDDTIVSNSFLLHGYYNFKHILFGRVRPNNKHTAYFIGVPGMYCNRERFMASMFGFNSFKKSCRSDYSNPYFGYWYQEI